MKIIILSLFITLNLFGQSDFFLLMGDAPKLTVTTNLMAWYKGDYGLTSSGWLDASGNSKDLHFTLPAWTPTLTGTKNQIPTALFDGIDDRSDSVLFTTSGWTIYLVAKPVTHTNYESLTDGGGIGFGTIREGGSEGVLQIFSTNAQAFNESVSMGTWAIFVAGCQSAAGGQKLYAQVNNNAMVGGSQTGVHPDLAGFKLGSTYASANKANFEMVEAIVYSGLQDAATIAKVIGYLNAKYTIY